MEYITNDSLTQALRGTGLSEGDNVLVHSNISLLGVTENYSREKLLDTYYTALTDVIGSEGTLCVPSYFWEYATKKIPFDIKLSPVSAQFGVFSQYVTSMEKSVRSCNPLFAVAAVGKNAEYISGGLNRFSHGTDSPWHRMYGLNTKMLFLGVDSSYMSFLHYIEYQVGITYRYNKLFNIHVYNGGKKVFDSTICFVRYLDKNITAARGTRNAELDNAGLLKQQKFGKGTIYLCQMQPVFDYYKDRLSENPYFNLEHPPSFSEGDYPLV